MPTMPPPTAALCLLQVLMPPRPIPRNPLPGPAELVGAGNVSLAAPEPQCDAPPCTAAWTVQCSAGADTTAPVTLAGTNVSVQFDVGPGSHIDLKPFIKPPRNLSCVAEQVVTDALGRNVTGVPVTFMVRGWPYSQCWQPRVAATRGG